MQSVETSKLPSRAEKVVALIQRDRALSEVWDVVDRHAMLGYSSAMFTFGNNPALVEMVVDTLQRSKSFSKIEVTETYELVEEHEEGGVYDTVFYLYLEFASVADELGASSQIINRTVH